MLGVAQREKSILDIWKSMCSSPLAGGNRIRLWKGQVNIAGVHRTGGHGVK